MVIYSQKLSLSVRERLLLHLLKYQKYENEFEVPEALTQAGISSGTRVARPNVSRAMKILINKGIVYEKLSHIRGHKRQKKVYLLKLGGLTQARELDETLGKTKIECRDKSGMISERALDEILAETTGNITKLDIILSLDDNGLCDFSILSGPPGDSASVDTGVKADRGQIERALPGVSKFVFMMNPPLELRHFYGRRTELEDLHEWYDSKGPKIAQIQGIPGIGKTTLALEMVTRNRHRTNILWYKLREWDNLNALIKYFSIFFKELGRKKLESQISVERSIEPGLAAEIVSNELLDLQAVVVIDDFHNATNDIIAFFSSLVPLIAPRSGILIILVTRELIKFYDRRDVLLSGTVVEFSLEGLDEQSSRQLLKIPSISDDQFMSIFHRTAGHPLYLELISSAADMDDNKDIYEFIHEEVLSKLSDVETNLMKMASVYRYPALAEAFFDDPEISYNHIDKLVARSYLVRHGLNLYDTHELIRTFFESRLTRTERIRYHKLASAYYNNILATAGGENEPENRASIIEARMELQYHLQRSDQEKEALKYTLRYGRSLIGAGKFELLTILDEYDPGSMDTLSRARLSVLKGEILTHLGDTGAAQKELKWAMKHIKGTSSDEKALVLTLMGENHAAREEWKEAGTYHERALKILSTIPEHRRTTDHFYALARSYNNLGLATKSAGEPENAVELYEKGLEILEQKGMGTVQDKAAILENLGLLLFELNQLESARDYFEKAISELEQAEDHAGLAKLFAMLGEIYVELGDIHTATEFFESGVNYWERAEDLSSATQTFLRLGQVFTDSVKSTGSAAERSPSYWERLMSFFSSTQEEDYRRISRLYDRIGGLYMHRGSWHKSMEFHEKALELFIRINDEMGVAKAYNNLGVLYRTRQEPVKALESYKKSLVYLERLGEQRGLAITHLNIGRLYERMDKVEESKKSFKSCVDIAGKNNELKHYLAMALLGLARQTGSGSEARAAYLKQARALFAELDDRDSLKEIDKLASE